MNNTSSNKSSSAGDQTVSDATVITIDGPSGSGKGTICRILAEQMEYHLLDSGSLYRLTGLSCSQKGIDFGDHKACAEVAANLNVEFKVLNDKVQIILDGQDVTAKIREEQAGTNASIVAAITEVRTALLQRQRDFAKAPGLIADGRDMGTVVFPNAAVKIFLTASSEERAERRYLQLLNAGQPADKVVILKEIRERDERDSNRAVAPLTPAEDAIILDSTHLSIDEVVNEIHHVIQHKSEQV